MANPYRNLHLENVEIPENYIDIVNEAGQWEYEEYDAFELIIQETQSGMDYGFDLDPFQDESPYMDSLNAAIEAMGHEVNGYGWEDYLLGYLQEHAPDLAAKVNADSESDTCGFYMNDTLECYRAMLGLISDAIRALVPQA